MKCAIVLNGDFTENYDFNSVDKIIACDAAFSELKKRRVTPDIVLGDFDSLGYTPENAIKFPVEKDMTDGELAIEYSLENGFDVSVSTEWGKATVVRGLRQSLIGMKRLGTSELTADELLDRIK